MSRKLLGLVFLAVVFPLVVAAQSQATTGIIRGTVTDPSGAAVANATVALREVNTGFSRQTVTNERGIYTASLLPLGTYDVSWPARTEEPNGKTSPEELIAAAHSACFSMAFSGALAKAGTPPTSLGHG